MGSQCKLQALDQSSLTRKPQAEEKTSATGKKKA